VNLAEQVADSSNNKNQEEVMAETVLAGGNSQNQLAAM